MSPETTLLTPRAEHPPGESGREKSRAALDMEKSHVNQCAPPQLFPFRCMGVPVSPSPDAGTGPTAEGNPGLPVAAGQRDGDGASPEPTVQNLLLRSHLQARQGKLMPPRPLVCHRLSRATESILSRSSTPKLGSRTGDITR